VNRAIFIRKEIKESGDQGVRRMASPRFANKESGGRRQEAEGRVQEAGEMKIVTFAF
jgi:hypothetical protein